MLALRVAFLHRAVVAGCMADQVGVFVSEVLVEEMRGVTVTVWLQVGNVCRVGLVCARSLRWVLIMTVLRLLGGRLCDLRFRGIGSSRLPIRLRAHQLWITWRNLETTWLVVAVPGHHVLAIIVVEGTGAEEREVWLGSPVRLIVLQVSLAVGTRGSVVGSVLGSCLSWCAHFVLLQLLVRRKSFSCGWFELQMNQTWMAAV